MILRSLLIRAGLTLLVTLIVVSCDSGYNIQGFYTGDPEFKLTSTALSPTVISASLPVTVELAITNVGANHQGRPCAISWSVSNLDGSEAQNAQFTTQDGATWRQNETKQVLFTFSRTNAADCQLSLTVKSPQKQSSGWSTGKITDTAVVDFTVAPGPSITN